MTNQLASSMLLVDTAGSVFGPSNAAVYCVAITSALVGSLTVYGLTTGNATPNAPSPWVLSPGSVGAYTHPGNGMSGGGAVNYALSNPSDSGKAVIAFRCS